MLELGVIPAHVDQALPQEPQQYIVAHESSPVRCRAAFPSPDVGKPVKSYTRLGSSEESLRPVLCSDSEEGFFSPLSSAT